MTTTARPRALAWLQDLLAPPSATDTGGPPPGRKTGPVLLGDIHGALGGRPVLLMLWDEWERDATEGDDESGPR